MPTPAFPFRLLLFCLLSLAAMHALSVTGLWPGVPSLVLDPASDPVLPGAVVAGLALAAAHLVRARRDSDRSLLVAAGLIPTLFLTARAWIAVAGALHPLPRTTSAYGLEHALWLPSFALARQLSQAPLLGAMGAIALAAVPLMLAAALVAEHHRQGTCAPLLSSLALLALVTSVLGTIVPLAGPAAAFGDIFPWSEPPLREAARALSRSAQTPRAAFPSLDLAVAGLAALRLRYQRVPASALAALLAAFAGLYLLGSGHDPAAALLTAPALALAADALVRWRASLAKHAVVACAAVAIAAWSFLLSPRFALLAVAGSTPLRLAAWTLALGGIAAPILLARRASQRTDGDAPPAPPIDLLAAALALVFALSGAAGLFYEVVFSKSLALTFGSTAQASTAVLAMYMGGMALGSWAGGALAARLKRPIVGYALCELGIAAWCSFSPSLLLQLRSLYVSVAASRGAGGRVLLQLALSGAALLPATLLMGMTLPLLIRALLRGKRGLGDSVGLLYGANTLGAAGGALIAGYVALPLLGVIRTTFLAVLANGLAAVCGFLLVSRRAGAAAEPAAEVPLAGSPPAFVASRRIGIAAVAVLLAGGCATFVLETAQVHLLAVVAGNSAFAFALMLFAFLIGLGAGAVLGRRWLRAGRDAAFGLVAAEVLLSLTLLLTVYRWAALPGYFADFQDWQPVRSFGAREIARSAVCLSILVPPALCIGAAYPLAMECVGLAWPARRIQALGVGAALNTMGNVAGALLGGFVLLPRAGSLATLQLLAATGAALALLPAAAARGRSLWTAALGCAMVAALFAAQPRTFDWTSIASGSNVYFAPGPWGKVVDHAESLDGGLTTVNESQGPTGRVRVLLTNGKFQGNDALGGEMIAQMSFALDPLRHLTRRGPALNIGFGTGTTARVLQEAGFARVDVVDLSADILRLADRWFQPVNGGVLQRPRVRTFLADGRNHLLLSSERYDLVSLEISSIWFAGAAALYNREFYELVRAHLAPEGLMQQWIQLHHISPADVASVLESVRAEFPQVWLYESGGQGVIVACPQSCPPTGGALEALLAAPDLALTLKSMSMTGAALRQEPLLDPHGIDAFLALSRREAPGPVSTDDNLHLEYSTPRGNARREPEGYQFNLEMLKRFHARTLIAR